MDRAADIEQKLLACLGNPPRRNVRDLAGLIAQAEAAEASWLEPGIITNQGQNRAPGNKSPAANYESVISRICALSETLNLNWAVWPSSGPRPLLRVPVIPKPDEPVGCHSNALRCYIDHRLGGPEQVEGAV